MKTPIDQNINKNWAILIALSGAMLLASFLQYELVFRPVIRQLVMEEMGTMVLLKMIPTKVLQTHMHATRTTCSPPPNPSGARNCAEDLIVPGHGHHRRGG